MAGTVDLPQRIKTGNVIRNDVPERDPQLPRAIRRFYMRIRCRGHTPDLRGTMDTLSARGGEPGPAVIRLGVNDTGHAFAGGTHAFRMERKTRRASDAGTRTLFR